VPIFTALEPYLRAQLGGAADDFLVPGRGRHMPTGKPFSSAAYGVRTKAAWDVAKLAHVGLHEARHSFASWLVLAGYDVATVSQWIGHNQISTTFDRYVKPLRSLGFARPT
jgi:site-specific recombinase XerD